MPKKLFRDGAGALVIKPPPAAVGENAPPEITGGQILDAAQIAEHLGRRGGFLPAPAGAAIERANPSLGFDDGEAEAITFPFFPESVGSCLRCSIGEKKPIRHVITASSGKVLLPKADGPAHAGKNRPDQVILGLAFVGRLRDGKAVVYFIQVGLQRLKGSSVDRGPVCKAGDGFG